ncbi:MAG: flagellar filament capping protein FliD [Myxococcaceae bacterium]|nr:flagellar filament capping protein FliD [Myxococcaceae bacterium]
MDATFRAGGLASGMDTNSIVEQLVTIEKRPLDLLKSRQDAMKLQVSALGDLASKLSALQTAAAAFQSGGVLALSAATSSSAYAITPTSGGSAGRYAVQVQSLASAAKARSQSFTSGADPVSGGTLALTVMGTTTNVSIADGASLSDVAKSINQSGAAVTANLLSDGTHTYLSLTNRDTGFPLTGAPGDALSITETTTGTAGQALGLGITSAATNAQLTVDGLAISRTSNTIADVIPGASLTLKTTSTTPEDAVLSYDTDATQKRLQGFVDAYNAVQKLVQKNLAVDVNVDRSKTLAGDGVARGLQHALQGLVSTVVPGLGGVRTLADLGFKTAQDGSLSLDSTILGKALTREPASVDALFSTASTGLCAVTSTLVKNYTTSGTGLLSARQTGLGKSISAIDDQLARMDARLSTYRQTLINQFSAMEKIVSGFKAIGNFLTQQENANSGSKG